jgi:ssDNA-binding Zn-finger/Zn-ribbon topoisomerase 1
MNPILIVVLVVIVVGLVVFGLIFIKKKKGNPVAKKNRNISGWSYQRFARFYGYDVLPDQELASKLEKIKKHILNDKLESIEEIAQKSGCTFDECILKIRYLKNKRVIGDYSVDRVSGRIKPCSPEELKLTEKYGDLVYSKRYQIPDMAKEVPNYHNMPHAILREDIFKDIKYMNDRMLLNGIKLNESERKIVYYTLEKHEKAELYDTLNCPSCGALVDVLRDGTVSCPKCGAVVKGTQNKDDSAS